MFTTLRAKVFTGFLLILLLLAALGGYAIYSLASLADATSGEVERSAEQNLANTGMYESLVRLDEAEIRMLTGDSDAGPVLAEEPAHFYYALQNAWASSSPQDSSAVLLNDIEAKWDRYHSRLDHFYGLALHAPLKARRLYEDTLEPEMDTLRTRNLKLQELTFNSFERAKVISKTRAEHSIGGVFLVAVIALGVGFVGSIVVSRRTIRPLRELTASVKELRGGHLDTRIPIHGGDEIADLGFEFNRLTERLREFEAMNVSEILREKQKSEAIIESIDDPLLLFDAAGRLVHVNRAGENMTGVRAGLALGQPLGALFREPNVRQDVERALERAARNLAQPMDEDLLVPPPIVSIPVRGAVRHYRIRIARILSGELDGEGNREPIAGILILFTDITHFKELDQMKSDFIAKVSHEFRTPLTSMTMSLDILGDELVGSLNAEQHDVIDSSKVDARRLAKLIRDLLTLSRLENVTDSRAAEEETNVRRATEELLRSMRPQYQERGIDLEAGSIADGQYRIVPEHFTSVLSNLLSNALKYTPRGGSVHVRSEWVPAQQELILEVRDTGIGIAPGDQERIFEKFVQIKHRDLSTPGSVGLGLAIVREIAARYDGRVELESEPGTGSTFRVRFHLERIAELEEMA